jgi:hypothetical protein
VDAGISALSTSLGSGKPESTVSVDETRVGTSIALLTQSTGAAGKGREMRLGGVIVVMLGWCW